MQLEKKAEHWWWMPYAAAMGQPALEECLNGNKERLSDVVRELRKEGEPFRSQRFVYGKSVESQVVQDRVDGLLHQAALDIPVKGQTKTQIAAEFEKLRGTGRFYSQHGLIMMSRGGQAAVFAPMRVQEVQTTVVLVDGALRILGLLRSEADCPPDVRWRVLCCSLCFQSSPGRRRACLAGREGPDPARCRRVCSGGPGAASIPQEGVDLQYEEFLSEARGF